MVNSFEMFSIAHGAAVFALCLGILFLFIFRNKWTMEPKSKQRIERLFALSLFVMEIFYHVWMISIGRWALSDSLPVELCSVSLLVAIVLLWTGNKRLINFVFFAGIGGALQAIATPVLDLGFPHFRYFHFFYTHIGIILTALYFVWMKGYEPTFKGIINTMIALNMLLPFTFITNILFQGNYMFLREKPYNGSLLDVLGPYPWYILSLEGVALVMFICLWLLFRKWRPTTKV